MAAKDTPQVGRAFADIMRIKSSNRYHIDVMETIRHYRLGTDEAVALRARLSAARREMSVTSDAFDNLTEAMRISNSYAKDLRLRATGPAPTGPNPYAPRAVGAATSRMSGS